MAYLNNFNANEVDPNVPFEAVPENKYLAKIVDSEMKPTKNGDGQYLQLEFEIIEGSYKGRKVWARLNLDNRNSTAVQIARGDLSSICRAVGVMQPKDSIELHNLPLCIKVVCKKREDTGEMTNEIKSYEIKEAITSAPVQMPDANGQVSAPTQSAPWKR